MKSVDPAPEFRSRHRNGATRRRRAMRRGADRVAEWRGDHEGPAPGLDLDGLVDHATTLADRVEHGDAATITADDLVPASAPEPQVPPRAVHLGTGSCALRYGRFAIAAPLHRGMRCQIVRGTRRSTRTAAAATTAPPHRRPVRKARTWRPPPRSGSARTGRATCPLIRPTTKPGRTQQPDPAPASVRETGRRTRRAPPSPESTRSSPVHPPATDENTTSVPFPCCPQQLSEVGEDGDVRDVVGVDDGEGVPRPRPASDA